MLDPVAQLAENGFRDVQRVLGDEINPHPFGTDQSHHLLNLFQKGLRGVVEQQMRLVEKEDQFRFFRVSDFGQLFKKLGKHPEQKG